MSEQQFASLLNPAFEHILGYLKPVQLYGQSENKKKKIVAFVPQLLQPCRSYSGFMNVQTHQDDLLRFAALGTSVFVPTYQISASLYM